MQKALNIINIVLEDISPMDLAARLFFSDEKRQVEHYLKICMDSLLLETTEDNFIPEDFGPLVTGSKPTRPVLSVPKPTYSSHRTIWLQILGMTMIIATIILIVFVL
jgi:hypothetical protein